MMGSHGEPRKRKREGPQKRGGKNKTMAKTFLGSKFESSRDSRRNAS